MAYNGVIETATGNLLRCGYCDFENDGSFDSDTETLISDVPFPGMRQGDRFNDAFHRWNGSEWEEIAQ